MKGRKIFNLLRPLIVFGVFSLKLTPVFFRLFIWKSLQPLSFRSIVFLRYLLCCSLVKKCGENVFIANNVDISHFNKLVLGSNVSIHTGCYIDAIGEIEIGNNVSIAHGSSLISFNHTWIDETIAIKYNPISLKKIVIEDDVWLGCGARILSGVTVHSRSIIAAGSVVVKDVATKTIVAGVPAKKLKEI